MKPMRVVKHFTVFWSAVGRAGVYVLTSDVTLIEEKISRKHTTEVVDS